MKTKARPECNSASSCWFLVPLLALVLSSFFTLSSFAETQEAIIRTLSVGDNPSGLAFDGANLWVVNNNDDTVMKLRPSDGKLLGTFSVGASPIAATFDGANIWVTNGGDDTVTKLQASDGMTVGSYAVGDFPEFVLFDGANIWTSNVFDESLTKLRASDGTVLGTFNVSNAGGITFDGENIWIANTFDGTVTKLRASDGVIVDVIRAGQSPTHVLFDGVNIWVADSGLDVSGKKLTKLLARNGAFQGQFTVDGGPGAMATDGSRIWVNCVRHSTIVGVRIKDGVVTSMYQLRKGLSDNLFDGTSIWVTNSADDKVTKITWPVD